MRQLAVMTVAVALAFCGSGQANADLARWQTQAQETSGNVVANSSVWTLDGTGGIDVNYGNLDADGLPRTQDLGASVEFIFNLEDTGETLCLGSLYGLNNTERNEYKLEQWSDTGKFGLSLAGATDARFDRASSIFDTDTHVVFVNRTDGEYEVFVNGIYRGTDTRNAPGHGDWVTNGGVGTLGSNADGADLVSGTIHALGAYNRALTGPEIGDLYAAWKGYDSSPVQLGAQMNPINGHYYGFGENATWDQARVNAAGMSVEGVPGHLVTVSNEAENRLVRQLAGDGSVWIGLTDATAVSTIDDWNPQAQLGTAEGDFRWVDGTPLEYQGWADYEPNDGGADAAVSRPSGWHDQEAGSTLEQGDLRLPSVVEYDTVPNWHKFDVLERKSTISLDHLAAAKSLLDLPPGDPQIAAEETGQLCALNFADPEAGNIGEDSIINDDTITVPFLTDTPGDDNYFALRATTHVEIPAAGEWTFAIVHDDYVELTIGDWHYSTAPSASGIHLHEMYLDAGIHPLELIFLECTGEARLQLFAVEGSYDTFDPYIFRQPGDVPNGGLPTVDVPEPSTLILLTMGAVGLVAYAGRRRRDNRPRCIRCRGAAAATARGTTGGLRWS